MSGRKDMNTKIIESEFYKIEGEDYSGLLPDGVISCTVRYERGRQKRVPISVDFDPHFVERKDETEEDTMTRYEEARRRVNPARTEREVRDIAFLLENSLQ